MGLIVIIRVFAWAGAQVFKLQESLQGATRVPIVRHTSCAVSATFPLEPASIISF